jgi:hypothetical protein
MPLRRGQAYALADHVLGGAGVRGDVTEAKLDTKGHQVRDDHPVARWVLVLTPLVLVAVFLLGYDWAFPSSAALDNTDTRAVASTRTLVETTTLENDSRVTETITGISSGVRGVVMTSVGTGTATALRPIPKAGLSFKPHHTVQITTIYRITNCTKPYYGPIPISVHLKHWAIPHTVTVHDEGNLFPDAVTICDGN